MKLNNKQVFSQELVHKPIKNQIFHLRHVIVLHSFQVLCIYEFEKEQFGFFEIWRARHQQAYIKNDIQFAGQISRPFEYDEESIAFLDSQTAKLYQMHYLELGYLKQIQVDLPTQIFKDIMAIEIDECIMEKYLMNCIQTQFVYDKKILIIEENLSVFEGPGGDVCDDTLFYSCLNSSQVGEAIIKKNREPLKFDVVDDKYVIIFRQNFFEEYLEFYVWDYFQKVEYSVPITVNINVNSCLLTCFLWNFEKFSKSEFDFIKQDPDNQQKIQINNLQIALFANSNASKHPQIYFISFDTVLKQIYSFKSHSIILDQGGSMIIQVPWIFKQLQEVLIHYYTNDMKLQVSVYNIEKTKKFKVYHQSQDGFVSNLYYSRTPQCIVDHLYMQKEEDLMEEQFQEIKTQIKMEDIQYDSIIPKLNQISSYITNEFFNCLTKYFLNVFLTQFQQIFAFHLCPQTIMKIISNNYFVLIIIFLYFLRTNQQIQRGILVGQQVFKNAHQFIHVDSQLRQIIFMDLLFIKQM